MWESNLPPQTQLTSVLKGNSGNGFLAKRSHEILYWLTVGLDSVKEKNPNAVRLELQLAN